MGEAKAGHECRSSSSNGPRGATSAADRSRRITFGEAWERLHRGAACPAMDITLKSAECRLKAEGLELMARTVSYRPDRDWLAGEARSWRVKEAAALVSEGAPEA